MTPAELRNRTQEWPADNVAAAIITADDLATESTNELATALAEGPTDDLHAATATAGDIDLVVPLASVTKLLVSRAVLIAVEEGACELDDDVAAAGIDAPEGATVRHFLAHAGGVGFRSRKAEREVETRRLYSSAGYEILADYIHKVTDIEFSEYLREAVLRPLGMTNTTLIGSAGHGAESTVRDLIAFAHELLQPRLISSSLHEESITPQYPDLVGVVPGYGMQRPCPWGLGNELRRHKSPHWTGTQEGGLSPETFGHFGQSGTYLWVDPTRQASMILLTDRDFGPWCKDLWAEHNDQWAELLERR